MRADAEGLRAQRDAEAARRAASKMGTKGHAEQMQARCLGGECRWLAGPPLPRFIVVNIQTRALLSPHTVLAAINLMVTPPATLHLSPPPPGAPRAAGRGPGGF
jgi:hypothetical protein